MGATRKKETPEELSPEATKLKLYLAGPMTGRARHNHDEFVRAAAMLRSRGYEVISPLEVTLQEDGGDIDNLIPRGYNEYIARGLKNMCLCDAVAVLPNWEQSVGTNIELGVATALRLPVLDAWTLEPLTKEAVNPKDIRAQKKIGVSRLPMAGIIHAAHAMADGKKKFATYNWRDKNVLASVYVDAAFRHLASYWEGEDVASDSKVHHLGHAIACLCITLDAMENGNLVDDRPKNKHGDRSWLPKLLDKLAAIELSKS